MIPFARRSSHTSHTLDQLIRQFGPENIPAEELKDNDIENVVRHAMTTLQWRNDYGVNDMRATNYPAEWFDTNVCAFYDNPDDSGN